MKIIQKCQPYFRTQNRSLKTKVVNKGGQNVRVRSKEPFMSTIGLEVHAQLRTQSKLFSRAPASYGAPANSQVSLFDASTPGTLPVINKRAVELALQTALALDCQINQVSNFDRKHYFYADLPAGYQITQQRRPLALKGNLDFTVLKCEGIKETYEKSASIIQLQIEQDSGKSLHDEDVNETLVDLNRCGSGLIEIVFGPDLFHGEEAASLVKELILILRKLDVCSCQMELGALRVDANISVRKASDKELGTRTEVKNINSVRGLVNAIESEVDRQIQVIEEGGVITNETRSYDANLKKSVPMRDKEVKQDYRFMPEPNLPPLRVTYDESTTERPNVLNISKFIRDLPELPRETRKRLVKDFGLSVDAAVRLVNEPDLLELFMEAQECNPKSQGILANLILIDLVHICDKHSKELKNCIHPEFLGTACNMKFNKEITPTLISKAFESAILEDNNLTFRELLEDKGWLKIFRNEKLIETLIDNVVKENPKVVKKYKKNGNARLLQELVTKVIEANDVLDAAMVKLHVEKKLK